MIQCVKNGIWIQLKGCGCTRAKIILKSAGKQLRILNLDFENQVLIVAGGASGIGLACSLELQNRGAKVYIVDTKAPPGWTGDFIECDIRELEQCKATVAKVMETSSKVHGLFISAGIYKAATIEESNEIDVTNIIQTNLIGPINLLKSILPIMRKQSSGSILLTGSDQTFAGKGKSAIYGASKGAIGQLTKSTAVQYGPHGIRVNCICPGATRTPMYNQSILEAVKKSPQISATELEAHIASQYPLGRIATPEEVAKVASFLLSNESSFITGALVPVDGGLTAKCS